MLMNTPTPTLSKENFIQNNQKIQDSWKKALTEGASLYLQKKQVGAHGIRFSGGNILVPLRDIHGNLQGVQCVDSEGQKRFLPGSQKQGHFHILGMLEGAGSLYFAEGYATAASIYEVTHCPVVVCFDVGNLSSVVAVFAQRYPNVYRIIAADNDWEKAENIGLKQAQKACALYECSLTYPRFSQQDANQGRSDFNDLMQAYGKEDVLRHLQIVERLDHAYPEVVPLSAQEQGFGDPFPVEALPPIIHDAVLEHQKYAKQALSLVVMAALTQVSLACQGLANVRRDAQMVGPISLYFAAIVPSGERKSTADAAFSKATKEWQIEKLDAFHKENQNHNHDLSLWETKKTGLQNKLKAVIDKPAESEKYTALLEDLLKQKPTPPVCPQLFYTDINQQTLSVVLASHRPSAGLISDEAGLFVGSNGMAPEACLGFFAFLNTLWDGGEYNRHRLNMQDARLVGRRFTCSLMMQPSVMMHLLSMGKGIGRDIGFLARMFMIQPTPTAGTRDYQEPPETLPYLGAFSRRIRALLDTPLPVDEQASDGRLMPPSLKLNDAAKALWVDYYHEVEYAMKPYGNLVEIQDFASKSAENAARLAACFHVFERGIDGIIHENTMHNAITCARWFLREALRIFAQHDKPQNTLDAESLWAWCVHKNHETVTLSTISRYGPNHLRKHRQRYKMAVNLLQEHGFLIKKDNVSEWIINPKAKT
jgi:putative DNA primase/helicase